MKRPTARGDRAFTTGQAARYCYVTPESILNWIRAGLLKAQRTAGGQFRIRVGDLRAFMVEQGMETGPLDAAQDLRLHCWDSRLEELGRPGLGLLEPCRECLVHRSGTLNCWELVGLLPLTGRRADRCSECGYHRACGSSRRESGEEPSSTAEHGTPT